MILFSCDKQAKKEPKVYDTPIYQELAAKYEAEPVSMAASGIRGLELTPSGLYVMEKMDGDVKTGVFEKEAFDADLHLVRIKLKGYGKVEIIDPTKAEGSVTLTFEPEGGAPIIVSAEPVAKTTDPSPKVGAIVGHSFKVTATELVISKYNISKTFEGGCDVPEILKYLEDKLKNQGFKADKDYSGYVVKDVTLTDASFIVRFANQKDLTAGISLDKDNKFSYKVSGAQVGNPIFNGEANGSISFDKWNEPIVSISAKITDNSGEEYTGSVKFYLSEIDPTKA